MEKGVPAPLAIVFLLTVPIVNPIVGAATKYAFFYRPDIVFIRLGGAYLLAVFIGFLTLLFWGNSRIINHSHSHHNDCCCGYHHHSNKQGARFSQAISHGQDEFFDILRYLVIGAFLAAFVQTFFPRDWLNMLGSHSESSVGVMMLMAFILSVCSGADAFVASTFADSFSTGAIVAFLVYGPMIDLKNLLMLRAAFTGRFVLYLFLIVTLLVFAYGVFINHIGVVG